MRRIALAALLALAPASGWAACDPELFLTERLQCRIDAALAAGTAQPCLADEDPAVRFNCIGRFAVERDDMTACALASAEDEAQALILREACIGGVVIARGDPEACRILTTPELVQSCGAMIEAATEPAAAPETAQ